MTETNEMEHDRFIHFCDYLQLNRLNLEVTFIFSMTGRWKRVFHKFSTEL